MIRGKPVDGFGVSLEEVLFGAFDIDLEQKRGIGSGGFGGEERADGDQIDLYAPAFSGCAEAHWAPLGLSR